MKLGIVGYFGYQNLGDEWFVKTWESLFGDVAEVRVLHPIESVEAFDGIIIGGGDLILPNLVNNNYFRDALYTKPFWIYGVGIPYDNYWTKEVTTRFKEIFDKAQGVYFRDAQSVALCKEHIGYEAKEVIDIAWGGPLPDDGKYLLGDFNANAQSKEHTSKWLGVSVRPEPEIVAAFMQFVDLVNCAWRSAGLSTICIPLHPTDIADVSDRKLHELLAHVVNTSGGRIGHKAPILVAPPEFMLDKRMGVISKCNVYATTRYHGAIAGLRYRVPTVVYASPNSVKFRTLNAVMGNAILVTHPAQLIKKVVEVFYSPVSLEVQTSAMEARAKEELMQFKAHVLSTLNKA